MSGLRKPKATPVFTGLLIAAIMRMLWLWLIGKKVVDPVGAIAIGIAAAALLYIRLFHSQDEDQNSSH
jgi:quinol-cytochrome oxidoreductase complex cytochrome b subunit